jgi:cytochrome c-type biogenesis protein CcmH/NrfF
VSYSLSIFFLVSIYSLQAQTGSARSDNLSGSQIDFFNSMSDELICQCGCNLVLSNCGHVNCPSAIPMRKQIEEMILAQKSKDDILKYFMTKYSFEGKPPKGRAILSQPDTKGFDLMAWIMPFILFAVFSVVMIFIVKRSTRKDAVRSVAPDAAPALNGLDKQIEEDLKKLE